MSFLHRRIPVDALCIYRMGFGLLLFLEACTWLPHARELFSSEGFHVSEWQAIHPSPALATAACLALAIASLSLCVGLFTRWANAVVAVLWTFLVAQDRINEKAIDTIVIVVLVLLLFTPCGARYSVDALRTGERPAMTSAFVHRLLQLEFAQVYFFCGIAKMMNPEWVDGSVFYQVFSGRWATGLGLWVSGWIPPVAARLGGLSTILYELLAGFLLFQRSFRPWVIAAGVLFHLGIQCSLSVGFLGWHFILALVTLFPRPEAVRDAARGLLGAPDPTEHLICRVQDTRRRPRRARS